MGAWRGACEAAAARLRVQGCTRPSRTNLGAREGRAARAEAPGYGAAGFVDCGGCEGAVAGARERFGRRPCRLGPSHPSLAGRFASAHVPAVPRIYPATSAHLRRTAAWFNQMPVPMPGLRLGMAHR